MLYHYFSLDDYFKKTRNYFTFIDGVFKLTSSKKKDVFEKLLIPDSTYRTNRLKEKAKYKWSYLPILEYFGYKDVNPNDQRKYELLLAKIYHNAYFKNVDTLNKLLIELNIVIDENNYLKPVFVLFRVLINAIINNHYSIQFANTKEDLEYLEHFRKDYLTEELIFLFLILKYYFGKHVNNVEMENYAVNYPKLLWLYYMLKGSYNYLHSKDDEALSYYELLLDIFWKDFNIERFSVFTSNVAFIYNIRCKYSLSLEKSSKLISYSLATDNISENNKYSVKHFIFSSYMLNKFDNIIEIFEVIDDISFLGDIYIAVLMIVNKINHSIYDRRIKDRIKQIKNLQDIDEMLISHRLDVEKLSEMYKKLPYWPKIVEKMQVDVLKI